MQFFKLYKKDCEGNLSIWLRGPDLNQRPPGYEPDELPLLYPAMYINII